MKKSTQNRINTHLDGINRAKQVCRKAHQNHTNPLLLRTYREVEKEVIQDHKQQLNRIRW